MFGDCSGDTGDSTRIEATDSSLGADKSVQNLNSLGKRSISSIIDEVLLTTESNCSEEPTSRRPRRSTVALKDLQGSLSLTKAAFNARVSQKPKSNPKGPASIVNDTNVVGSPGPIHTTRRVSAAKTPQAASKPASIVKKSNEGSAAVPKAKYAAKSAPKNGKDPKEKVLDELEKSLISNALQRKAIVSVPQKSLPEGPTDFVDLDAALARSVVDSSSPPFDWSSREALMIGCICKVYWDGDKQWFYARILNYDRLQKKHYIYYFTDSTAEWISIDDEAVIVGSEIKLVENKNLGLWPAIVFYVSPKAEPAVFKQGHEADEVYVEFFNEKKQLDKQFSRSSCLHPLSVDLLPERMSKKYTKCWEAAKIERLAIDNVIDEVQRSIRNNVFRFLKGEDWVGQRVRAPTHRILTKAEKKSLANSLSPIDSVFCTGTVRKYCSQTNEHLVVFEEAKLQPQWVSAVKGNIEILVDSSSSSVSSGSSSTALVATNKTLQSIPIMSTMATRKSAGGEVENVAAVSVAYCKLCDNGCEGVEATTFCSSCSAAFHPHCLPANDSFKILNESSTVKKHQWKCPDCSFCQGCDANQWTTQLIYWNSRRIDPNGPDKTMLLCGLCLDQFKHNRDYCTICFKLYSAESPFQLGNDEKDAKEHEEKKISTDMDESMVQCNECDRWVHAKCEGIDQAQYHAISEGTHPIWGDEYLCPICRVQISSNLISALQGMDSYLLFAEPVTTSVAANYFDVIRNPMDLSTMKEKSQKGMYKSLQATRQDMELMVLNAFVFNNVGDDCWRIAKDFYWKAVDLFVKNRHKTATSAFGKEAEQMISKWTPPDTAGSKRKPAVGTSEEKDKKATDDFSRSKRTRRGGADGEGGETSSSSNMDATATVDEEDKEKTLHEHAVTDDLHKKDDIEQHNKDIDQQVISLALCPNPDPVSFAAPFHSLVSSEEAYFTSCMDHCFVCGAGENSDSNNMLFCIDCGEAYHCMCAMIGSDMPRVAKDHWRCVNCKICEMCGLVTETDAETLVFCEHCDRTFHIQCVSPALESVPEYDWFCGDCVKCTMCESKSVSVAMNVEDGDVSCTALSMRSDSKNKTESEKETETETKRKPCTWSRSLSCCLQCDHTPRGSSSFKKPQQQSNTLTATSHSTETHTQGAKRDIITCFDCRMDFSLSTAERRGVDPYFWICSVCSCRRQELLLLSSSSSSSSNSLTVNGSESVTHHTTTLSPPSLSSSAYNTHMGNGKECLTLLDQITRIQALRHSQITRTKAQQLSLTREPLHVFRMCNGLYFVMMVLWASLRSTFLSQQGYALINNNNTEKRERARVLTANTQWISARSRRFLVYSRRRIQRHRSHPFVAATPAATYALNLAAQSPSPIHAQASTAHSLSLAKDATLGSEGKTVRLPLLLSMSTEAMTRLAQMASTFLFLTETERYREEVQVRELAIVLVQIAFLLMHESPGGAAKSATASTAGSADTAAKTAVGTTATANTTANTTAGTANAAAPASNTTTAPKTAPTPTPSTVSSALQDERARRVVDLLRGLYNRQGISPNALLAMGLLDARKLCLSRRGVHFVVSHNFSLAEGADIVRVCDEVFRSTTIFNHDALQIMCQFLENAFFPGRDTPLSSSHTAMSHNGKAPFKSPAELLHYFHGCKNPLISPGFIVPVDAFPALVDAHNLVEERERDGDGEGERVVRVETWRAGGLARSAHDRLLSSHTHRSPYLAAILENQHAATAAHNNINAAGNSSKSKSKHADIDNRDIGPSIPLDVARALSPSLVLEQNDHKRYFLDPLVAVRRDVLQYCKDCEYADFDKIDNKVLVDMFVDKYVERNSKETKREQESERVTHAQGEEVAERETPAEKSESVVEEEKKPESASEKSASATAGEVANQVAQPTSTSQPLRGWSSEAMEQDWLDPRSCVFCGEGESVARDDDKALLGRLLPFSDGSFAHVNCLAGCHEVEEIDNVLVNAYAARDRCFRDTCYLCRKRGATFSCCSPVKRCRRVFHLKCALACKAVLFEREDPVGNSGSNIKNNNNNNDSGRVKRCVVTACPAHVDVLSALRAKFPKSRFSPWRPGATQRCVIIERQESDAENKTIAALLAQRRTDKAAKSGTLTVFSIGTLVVNNNCTAFCSPNRLFPLGFRASRVYWSMRQPRTRTLYVFDVLSMAETESWDLEQVEYLHVMLEDVAADASRANHNAQNGSESSPSLSHTNTNTNTNAHTTTFNDASPNPSSSNGENIESVLPDPSRPGSSSLSAASESALFAPGPLFRCMAIDQPETPLFARSLEDLHAYILRRVKACNAETRRAARFVRERSQWTGYGLNAAQFFGLGVPFVRQSIEQLPDAVAAMTLADEAVRYRPCFRLPSAQEIQAMQHVVHSGSRGAAIGSRSGVGSGGAALSGSSRADPFQDSSRGGGGTRITRILTKIAADANTDDSSSSSLCGVSVPGKKSDDDDDDEYAADLEQDGNRAEVESRVYKFLDMTAAYVRNPFTKLEVRKSSIHGWGLFAKMNFEKDDVLVEYIGEKIRQAVADRREVMYEQNGVGSCYLFRLDKDDIIDATATGAMARFMNHCCEPNAYAKIITFFANGVEEKHIVILAARDIQEGEEITYDYKFPIEEKKLKCYCGAPKCSGAMN